VSENRERDSLACGLYSHCHFQFPFPRSASCDVWRFCVNMNYGGMQNDENAAMVIRN
jgi:hypothetical protein